MLTSLFLLFIEYHSDHLNMVALPLYVWFYTSQFNSRSISLGHFVRFMSQLITFAIKMKNFLGA